MQHPSTHVETPARSSSRQRCCFGVATFIFQEHKWDDNSRCGHTRIVLSCVVCQQVPKGASSENPFSASTRPTHSVLGFVFVSMVSELTYWPFDPLLWLTICIWLLVRAYNCLALEMDTSSQGILKMYGALLKNMRSNG